MYAMVTFSNVDKEQEEVSEPTTGRPRRMTIKPDVLNYDKLGGRSGNYAQTTNRLRAKLQSRHHLYAQRVSEDNKEEYDPRLAGIMAFIMHSLKEKIGSDSDRGNSFAQQYILQKGLKIFGARGDAAASKEVKPGKLAARKQVRSMIEPMANGKFSDEEQHQADEERTGFVLSKLENLTKNLTTMDDKSKVKQTRNSLAEKDESKKPQTYPINLKESSADAKSSEDHISAQTSPGTAVTVDASTQTTDTYPPVLPGANAAGNGSQSVCCNCQLKKPPIKNSLASRFNNGSSGATNRLSGQFQGFQGFNGNRFK